MFLCSVFFECPYFVFCLPFFLSFRASWISKRFVVRRYSGSFPSFPFLFPSCAFLCLFLFVLWREDLFLGSDDGKMWACGILWFTTSPGNTILQYLGLSRCFMDYAFGQLFACLCTKGSEVINLQFHGGKGVDYPFEQWAGKEWTALLETSWICSFKELVGYIGMYIYIIIYTYLGVCMHMYM